MGDQTYGPAYNQTRDGERLANQLEVIRDYMLQARGTMKQWRTLAEIEHTTGYPQATISAQLRHLRKAQFGAYGIDKRRRAGTDNWEYAILLPAQPPSSGYLFDVGQHWHLAHVLIINPMRRRRGR